MPSILVADDHANIRSLICTYLARSGYKTYEAANGLEAIGIMDKVQIDLLIADLMMPGMDGITLIHELRTSAYHLPILIISAKEGIDDKRQGFRAGTDDYMVKPIDFDEMLLRVAALLRRARIANERKIVIGRVVLDAETLAVRIGQETVELPVKEFKLLFKFLSYPQKIFTRQNLMDEIWGLDHETDERTIDVHINRLREKFSHLSEFKITTVRGLGYKADVACPESRGKT